MATIYQITMYVVQMPDGSIVMKAPSIEQAKDWCKENGEQYQIMNPKQ